MRTIAIEEPSAVRENVIKPRRLALRRAGELAGEIDVEHPVHRHVHRRVALHQAAERLLRPLQGTGRARHRDRRRRRAALGKR